MSSVVATLTLVEVTFPDITGKILRGWGQVLVSPGSYVTGGLPMGLIGWADQRTVDFNGFLRCEVWDEEVQGAAGLTRYHYNPVTDTLQVFSAAGVEVPNGTAVPVGLDTSVDPDKPMTQAEGLLLMFEASWDRTTVRG